MGWTTEKPKEAGWYWWRNNICVDSPVSIFESGGVLCFLHPLAGKCVRIEEAVGEWQGPIRPEP